MKLTKVSLIVVILSLAFLVTGCFPSSGDDATIAERRLERFDDNWPSELRLDVADVEDVVDYMGRATDDMRMGRGNNRELVFEMSDGSELIFVMSPAASGGLVLDYIDAD